MDDQDARRRRIIRDIVSEERARQEKLDREGFDLSSVAELLSMAKYHLELFHRSQDELQELIFKTNTEHYLPEGWIGIPDMWRPCITPCSNVRWAARLVAAATRKMASEGRNHV